MSILHRRVSTEDFEFIDREEFDGSTEGAGPQVDDESDSSSEPDNIFSQVGMLVALHTLCLCALLPQTTPKRCGFGSAT